MKKKSKTELISVSINLIMHGKSYSVFTVSCVKGLVLYIFNYFQMLGAMKKILIIIFSIIGILILYFSFYQSGNPLDPSVKIDKVVVYKSNRQLLVYSNGVLLKTYKIALGLNPLGAKQFEGDGKHTGRYLLHY